MDESHGSVGFAPESVKKMETYASTLESFRTLEYNILHKQNKDRRFVWGEKDLEKRLSHLRR